MKYDAIPRYPAVFRLSISQTDNKVTPRVQDDVNPSSILPGWCDYWKKAREKEVKFRLEQNIFLWEKLRIQSWSSCFLLLLLLRAERNPYRMYTWKENVCAAVCTLLHICQERGKKKKKEKKRNGAIRSVKVLTGTFPLSSATRGGPPRGRRRRDRAVPSCGPTRPAPYPCPFASPCRDPAPSPDPSSPLSPILCLAACPCARSPCSSLAPSLVHVPGFCPTLFRPQAAKEATLETKIHAILIKLYSLSLFLLIEISIIRSIFRGISIYAWRRIVCRMDRKKVDY